MKESRSRRKRTIVGASGALTLLMVFLVAVPVPSAETGNVYFVAPDGSDRAAGTEDDPFGTIGYATALCKPGDQVLIRGGVYDIDLTLWRSGAPGSPIVIGAYPGERVVLDGSSHVPGLASEQLLITGSWLVVHDLEVRRGPAEGVLVIYGSGHVVLQRLVAHDNASTGIQLDHDVHDVLVLDCDSWGNVDRLTHGEHADGFAAKFGVGANNRFTGCRAWNNADDGFDLYDARNTVEIDHSWAFGNGFDRWNLGPAFAGDGNGIKLGAGRHVVHHCLAWHNARRGFDDNDSLDPVLVANNTSYGHPVHGFQFTHGRHHLVDNVSLEDATNAVAGTVQDHNSWNDPPGIRVDAADFLSLDDAGAAGPRQPDGGLPRLDFLRPAPGSPLVDAGMETGFAWAGAAPDLGGLETGWPAEEPRRPFPQHPVCSGASSSLNVVDQATADADLAAYWDHWKRQYLATAGLNPAGRPVYRVAFGPRGTGRFAETVSEGQGYGMILVAEMAGYESRAREIFDGLWRFARSHPSHQDPRFMTWIIPEREGDLDCAFDGEADMALALMMAAEQWGCSGEIDYHQEAATLMEAMAERLLGPESHLPLLGDWIDPHGEDYNQYTVRTSDFMPASFELFATVAVRQRWLQAAATVRKAARALQDGSAPSTGLLPDFAVPASPDDPDLIPAPPNFLEGLGDGAFSYNACRDPWRFAMDVLINADPLSLEIVSRLSHWAESAAGGDPGAIVDGYTLDGIPLSDTEPGSTAFLAPLGAAARVVPGQGAWLDALWTAVHRRYEGYYEDSLDLLSMLFMAGDFWLPTPVLPPPRRPSARALPAR